MENPIKDTLSPVMAPMVNYVEHRPDPRTMPPEVSIILPCYNAHNTLKRCLASIAMQQNIDEIEVIIADDCSDNPEGYHHIAQQFAHMMKIRIVRMEKNGGPGAARQVGFDHSHGRFIMWMDADDTLVSADSILTLKMVMIQKEMDCVYGKFLEQNEDGSIYPHETHMVWMFGKLYRREFLEKYQIRFNTSLSNEDTGFNAVVKGCSDRIWYIPKDVYIWHFKANSITRIKNGMYGQDSGYKGWLDNMMWQIEELKKRFVNRNYILSEVINTFCVLYHFHVENMQNYPMNTNISLNWARGFYEKTYKQYEEYITEEMLMTAFRNIAAGQNIASKGIVPQITFYDFIKQVKEESMKEDPDEEICGATPAGYIPPITDPNWPVTITDYFNMVEDVYSVNSDTNVSRYGGMKKKLGIPLTDKDYDPHYSGERKFIETDPGRFTDQSDLLAINMNLFKNNPTFHWPEPFNNDTSYDSHNTTGYPPLDNPECIVTAGDPPTGGCGGAQSSADFRSDKTITVGLNKDEEDPSNGHS